MRIDQDVSHQHVLVVPFEVLRTETFCISAGNAFLVNHSAVSGDLKPMDF
jgi:hypothetical protein